MPYLVIDVGDVHYKLDVELEVVAQYAPNDIRGHIIARMAEMCIIVNGGAANIP